MMLLGLLWRGTEPGVDDRLDIRMMAGAFYGGRFERNVPVMSRV